jgi:putative tricarboxylic transport membrane protein
VLVIAACLYELVRRLAFGGRRGVAGVLQDLVEESVEQRGDGGAATAGKPRPGVLVAGIALTALYVWLIQTLGFALATAPYLAAFVALGGYRRWTVNAAVSLVGTLVMMFFFMKVVYVSLPIGREPFAQVTLFLMQVMGIR